MADAPTQEEINAALGKLPDKIKDHVEICVTCDLNAKGEWICNESPSNFYRAMYKKIDDTGIDENFTEMDKYLSLTHYKGLFDLMPIGRPSIYLPEPVRPGDSATADEGDGGDDVFNVGDGDSIIGNNSSILIAKNY